IMGVMANNKGADVGAIIFDRPYINILDNMLNDQLPLSALETLEWGNPNEEVHYRNIRSYSPYQNIALQEYPNMLFFSKYYDRLTPYWDIFRAVAKYRFNAVNQPLILLHTDYNAGHYGNVNHMIEVDNLADKYAFIMHQLSK